MADYIERRATERFKVNADTSCPLVSPVAEDFGPVKIRDVSMEGIGLLTSKKVEPGTLLAITLVNVAKGFQKVVLVRVTHATPLSGGCLVGGTFTIPLTYQEMTALVL